MQIIGIFEIEPVVLDPETKKGSFSILVGLASKCRTRTLHTTGLRTKPSRSVSKRADVSPFPDPLNLQGDLGGNGHSGVLGEGRADLVTFSQCVEYYTQREEPVPGLRSFVPFTSEDCDIWVSAAAQKYIEAKKEGRLTKSRSPLDGQLAILDSGLTKVCHFVNSLGGNLTL